MATLVFVLIAAELIGVLGLVLHRYLRGRPEAAVEPSPFEQRAGRFAATPATTGTQTGSEAHTVSERPGRNDAVLAKWIAALVDKVGELKTSRDTALLQANQFSEEVARLTEREQTLAKRVAALEGHLADRP